MIIMGDKSLSVDAEMFLLRNCVLYTVVWSICPVDWELARWNKMCLPGFTGYDNKSDLLQTERVTFSVHIQQRHKDMATQRMNHNIHSHTVDSNNQDDVNLNTDAEHVTWSKSHTADVKMSFSIKPDQV